MAINREGHVQSKEESRHGQINQETAINSNDRRVGSMCVASFIVPTTTYDVASLKLFQITCI